MNKNVMFSVATLSFLMSTFCVFSNNAPTTFQPHSISLKYKIGSYQGAEPLQEINGKLMNVMLGGHKGIQDLVDKLFNFINEVQSIVLTGTGLVASATTSPTDMIQAAEQVATAIAFEGLENAEAQNVAAQHSLSLIYTITINDVADETELANIAEMMQAFVTAVNGKASTAADIAQMFANIFESVGNLSSATTTIALQPTN